MNEENQQPGKLQASIQDIPRETIWPFVLAVLFAQAGLLGVSLGLMFVGFQDRWTLGGILFAGGVAALVITAGIHRWHRART